MERAYYSTDVQAAEAPRLAAGEPLMELAAFGLAQAVIRDIKNRELRVSGSTGLALVGPGNNGGDALFASAYLAQRGMKMTAVIAGKALAEGLTAARQAGVRIIDIGSLPATAISTTIRSLAFECGTWIDGVLGIGARGAVREPWDAVFALLNEEHDLSPEPPTVVAVDIPSGLNPNSGALPKHYLAADLTVTMGANKPALLLPPACFVAGDVTVVELGFERDLPAQAPVAELTDADIRDLYPVPDRDDHKYTRGVLGLVTGSPTYPGAGILSAGAAHAMGLGMLRYLGSAPEVVSRYPDVVIVDGKVQAYVVGSGLDDLAKAREVLRRARADGTPVVLDAGAIQLVAEEEFTKQPELILTPHEGELAQLCEALGMSTSREEIHADPYRVAAAVAEKTGAIVVGKGAVDVAVAPDGRAFAQRGAPAWRGTAGSGDVLAGLIGAMIALSADKPAQRLEYTAAALHIHARAAQISAGVSSTTSRTARVGQPITASTLVSILCQTMDQILNPEALR